jgi:hypothetical protein
MDRIKEYQQLIKEVLREIAKEIPVEKDIVVELTFDDENGHYYIVETGWQGYRRIHGILIHCSLRDGKVYVEHDGTSAGVADMLLERGVPYSDMVIGFHHPSERHYTPFAVA